MYKKYFIFLLLVFNNYTKENYDYIYEHENFIISTIGAGPISNDESISIAKNLYSSLNYSKFFDTELIVNVNKVQAEFAKDPTHKEIVIETKDKQKLTCSFFDRKKETVIIVGPGFTNAKEKMAPFVHMFTDHDILIMNFRGHGKKSNLSFNPFYYLAGVDSSCVKLAWMIY